MEAYNNILYQDLYNENQILKQQIIELESKIKNLIKIINDIKEICS